MPVVNVSGNEVVYGDVGSGPVLVFVHGLFMNGGIWNDVVGHLSDRFRCITPDLPLGGHQSPVRPKSDLSPMAVGAMIPALITELKLRDVTVVANDTGTALTLIALDSGEPGLSRISRLVLTNGDSYEHFPPAPMRGMVAVAKVAGGPAARLLGRTARRPRGRRRLAAPLTASPDVPAPVGAALDRLRNIGVRRDAVRFIGGMHRTVTLDAAHAIADFDGPVLLAWGRADEVFPVSHAKRLAEDFRHAAVIEIPESKTLVMVDAPERLAQLIADFVGRTKEETAPVTNTP
jgi:pimeloyl-ACP methyl ester carboxylesterase